ncbi:MAG: dihydrodipicolinate synthase family protein [Planctomycetes bacterium]|nr:dihydrodipicolinate synthase family protein [Planctomycetota bacterium]MCH9726515.1 dihydrodipicolinate synthase family protein [Planctomycetota bacterium]MCH9778324.1 dihydrodipicolinate synthase family protein [Planctomycetota bacterium]MCH9792418.1 dihydrodipicolinate synthase family protein [Planctomycetota bacterium]MDF1746171.1 dihydrodipicolinate synthase family protein [Gimesia sp.]
MSKLIQGVLPVLHTPLQADETIDRESLQREIDWCYELGVDGVCGAMVSEVLRLTFEERLELTRLMSEMSDGRGVVISSVGAESTRQALAFAHHSEELGCDAIMAIPPVMTALPESALWDYFSSLAEQCHLPLIVQDASSYVGREISVDFYRKLLDQFGPEKILFKPEAAPIGPNLSVLRDATEGRARIFDGSGGVLLVDAFRRGISGTMPGVDLLDGIMGLWRALQAGDEAATYRIYFPICAIVNLQLQAGLDGFLAIEKYLLVKRGIFTSEQRCTPHSWDLDDETKAEVDRLFELLMQSL